MTLRTGKRVHVAALCEVLGLVFYGVVGFASPAIGAFPGTNGLLAYVAGACASFGGGTVCVPDVFTANSDGSNQTNLTHNIDTLVAGGSPDTPYHARWSPDGTKIVYQNRTVGNYEIYVINADGSNRVALTTDGFYTDFTPSWSSDGSKIAWGSDRSGFWDIWTMNAADGSSKTQLTADLAEDRTLSWSPDGTQIAVSRSPMVVGDLDFEIFTMNADGTGLTNLTNNSYLDTSPDWSPDGTKIAFERYGADGIPHVWVMDAHGRHPAQLTFGVSPGEGQPAFSPDGTKIAFVDFAGALDVMNADGTGATTVISPFAAGDYPDWQPVPSSPSTGTHDVGVAGGGFSTKSRISSSRNGLGPFPITIKLKNFGTVSEKIMYKVESTPVGDTFSLECADLLAGMTVQPGKTAQVNGCTVTYGGLGSRTLTLTVVHDDTDGGTDSSAPNNSASQPIQVKP